MTSIFISKILFAARTTWEPRPPAAVPVTALRTSILGACPGIRFGTSHRSTWLGWASLWERFVNRSKIPNATAASRSRTSSNIWKRILWWAGRGSRALAARPFRELSKDLANLFGHGQKRARRVRRRKFLDQRDGRAVHGCLVGRGERSGPTPWKRAAMDRPSHLQQKLAHSHRVIRAPAASVGLLAAST